VGALALCWLLHLSWMLFRWGPPSWQPFLAGLLYVPVFLLAALGSGLAARRLSGRERVAWVCLGLAVLAFGSAQSLYTYIQEVLHNSPFPSAADALFLLVSPLLAAALAWLPGAPLNRAGWLRLGLDVGIMIGATSVLSWRFLLSGVIQAYQGQPLAGTIALAYPLLDLMLLFFLLLLLARRQQRLEPMTLTLGLGLLAFVVADSGFALLGAQGAYVPGHSIDLFWSTGGLLFGVTAALRLQWPASAAVRPIAGEVNLDLTSGWLVYGPHLAVAVSFGLLIETTEHLNAGPVHRGVVYGTALVALLVVLRQVLAYTDALKLAAALRQAGELLERRVTERTADLSTAHEQVQRFSEQLELKVQQRTAALHDSQALLAHQAQHDVLTGMPNRALFEDRLKQALTLALRHQRTLAVVFIDLDGFKTVNDTLGHAAGDDVLRVLAGRLQRALRDGDTVARMGGDEFMVLLTDLRGAHDALQTAQRLLSVMALEVHLGGEPVHLTASVGLAVSTLSTLDAALLKRQADLAMYQAKQSGKNQLREYTPEMDSWAQGRSDMAAQLRGAARRGELHLVYQPLVGAASGELQSFEALLRWTSPNLGVVPPGDFIPVAEDHGLIVELGNWVLDEVCRQQAAWQREGLAPVVVAVNVSPLQVAREDFVVGVQNALQRHRVEGRWLDLELTERSMVRDLGAVVAKITELRAAGVQVSIDDFGAGRTSLGDLMRFPVGAVKIDRSLVHNLQQGAGAERVLHAIVALAQALNLGVVAEGIETPAQLEVITRLGCERAQGYLLGRPESAAAARAQLVRRASAPSSLAGR
jgi:diguanylate cyclase